MTDTSGKLPPTLRLALAMRGGVSLSVWIGGAVLEIDTLRRSLALAPPPPESGGNALAALARSVGYQSVELDVISGASAGGLNGVVVATAMAADAPVADLRDVWMEAGDLRKLLHPSGWTTRKSLLSGEVFHARLEEGLRRLLDAGGGGAPVPRIDLVLSVTSIVPSEVGASTDPNLPVTEERVDGQIHLRHRVGSDGAYSDFVDVSDDGAGPVDLVEELALAARSTASFPVAFPPVKIDGRLDHKIEIRPRLPDPLLLYDGGVVDNMPVGKAARAISDAPADGPTRRVLLYLHPSPSDPDADAAKSRRRALEALREHGARPMDVLQSALHALRSKSLVDDLHAIEGHNAGVARRRRDRERLLAGDPVPALPPADRPDPADIAALDAEHLVDLLAAPWDHLVACVPPVVVPAALAARPGTEVEALREELAATLLASRPPGAESGAMPLLADRSHRPWAPIVRTASLLVEWCRRLEDAGGPTGLGAHKAACYEVLTAARRAADDMNRATLEGVKVGPRLDGLAAQLAEVRTGLAVDARPAVTGAWGQLGEAATCIAHLVAGTEASAAAATAGRDGRLVTWLGAIDPGAPVADVCRRLDAVDCILLPLHRHAPLTALDEIRYETLSGRADTPLAECYPWPADPDGPAAWPTFTTLKGMPAGADGRPASPGAVDPGSKLAGNQLHNFAAFLETTWRANDWMWGQLDAASTLTRVLLTRERAARLSAEAVHDICVAPLAGPWRDELQELVEQPWAPGTDTRDRVAAELAALAPDTAPAGGTRAGAAAAEPPPLPLTRGLLLWRRQIEIVAGELGRPADDHNPAGTGPGPSLRDTMRAWDGASRRLSDRWGEADVTALGMRAAFVGWKALFDRTGPVLRAVRGALAPVLAPVVGLLLARRRPLVVVELFLLGAVVPRTYDSVAGRIVVAVAAVVVAAGGWYATRRAGPRGRIDPWGPLAGALALAVVVASRPNGWPDWPDDLLRLRPPGGGRTGWFWPYLAPVSAAMVGTAVAWYWARWNWRALLTLLSGIVIYAWVWLGGRDEPWWGLRPFGSLWWGVIVGVLVANLVGYTFDTARHHPPPPPVA